MHQQAFGLKVFKESFDVFLAQARDYTSNVDFGSQFYEVELNLPLREFTPDIGAVFAAEDIWGSGVEQPYVRLSDIDPSRMEVMGKEEEHLKINSPKIDIVIFNCPELIEKLRENSNLNLSVIGQLTWNAWSGERRLQLMADDYQTEEKSARLCSIYDF